MNTFALVLNSLWQAAAIAAVMWVVLRSMPRVNAATRYVIWWAVLLVVLLLPLATVMIPRHNTVPAAVVASATGAAVNPLMPEAAMTAIVTLRPEPSSKWPVLIMVIWCAVFLYSLVRIACSWRYLRAIKSRAKSFPRTLPAIGRDARLLLSAEVSSPMAVGFLKPAVILPESLPSDLESAELDYVLLHESAHLARFDDWTNLAARLLAGALAFHPVALWILRQIEREREIACDEWVVARTGQARDYAASLARMCELRSSEEQALATGIFGRHSKTVRRIELLLKPGREFSSHASISRIAWSCVALLALWAGTSRAPHLVAFAQQPTRPSFEAASIKPGDPDEGRRGIGTRGIQFEAFNYPLKDMIGFAYDVQAHQIFGGPKWIDSDLFTIVARPSAGIPLPDDPDPDRRVGFNVAIKLMLQSLMEERFKLAVHRETRMGPIYELVVAMGGSKLKETAGSDGRWGLFGSGQGAWTANNVSIVSLVHLLSERLGRPVSDKTGLIGKYDFKLTYVPEPTQQVFGAPPPETLPPVDSNAPSIFTALQEQLGLKLESARGSVEVLVIDNAERPKPN
jgi:uncharacterized protein (TIGR03435 family)